MEETLVAANNNQFLSSVAFQFEGDKRDGTIMVRIPLGIYIPAGLKYQVDDGELQSVPLMACDPQGCYAEGPVSTKVLASIKVGKRLILTFQNISKTKVAIPLPLENFSEALRKIQ